MVPPGRVELPLPKEEDFESTASTNSATGAHHLSSHHSEKPSRINQKVFIEPSFIQDHLMKKIRYY